MVVKADVPHPTEVDHPSKAEAAGTIEVTPSTFDKAPPTDDVDVTPPVETHFIAPASADPSVHTDEGFPGGPIDTYVFTGYVDHVSFRLWKGEVCI